MHRKLLIFILQLNVGSVGFYRTQYTTEMLDKLIPAIKDKSLPPRDRLGLQNDIFAMVNIFELNYFQILYSGIVDKLLDVYNNVKL